MGDKEKKFKTEKCNKDSETRVCGRCCSYQQYQDLTPSFFLFDPPFYLQHKIFRSQPPVRNMQEEGHLSRESPLTKS